MTACQAQVVEADIIIGDSLAHDGDKAHAGRVSSRVAWSNRELHPWNQLQPLGCLAGLLLGGGEEVARSSNCFMPGLAGLHFSPSLACRSRLPAPVTNTDLTPPLLFHTAGQPLLTLHTPPPFVCPREHSYCCRRCGELEALTGSH